MGFLLNVRQCKEQYEWYEYFRAKNLSTLSSFNSIKIKEPREENWAEGERLSKESKGNKITSCFWSIASQVWLSTLLNPEEGAWLKFCHLMHFSYKDDQMIGMSSGGHPRMSPTGWISNVSSTTALWKSSAPAHPHWWCTRWLLQLCSFLRTPVSYPTAYPTCPRGCLTDIENFACPKNPTC